MHANFCPDSLHTLIKKPAFLFAKVCLNLLSEDNQKNYFSILDNYKSSIKIDYRNFEVPVIGFMSAYECLWGPNILRFMCRQPVITHVFL
jgi:hypothetical protein